MLYEKIWTNFRNRREVKLSFLLALAGTIFLALNFNAPVYSQTNQSVNFQGKIVRNDSGNEGLNVSPSDTPCVVNGGADTCDFNVNYYSASSGGTLFGDEVFSNIEIGDYNGVFNLPLGTGSYTAGSESNFLDIFINNDSVYLEVRFDSDNNGSFEETFSRMPVRAVPYAIRASELGGIASDGFVQLAPPSAQTDSSTVSSININKTGASGNLLTLQKNGVDQFVIANSGYIGIGNSTPTTGRVVIDVATATTRGLVINSTDASSANNLQEWRMLGTTYAKVTNSGAANFQGLAVGTSTISNGARFYVTAQGSSWIGAQIDGVSGQTADLLQIRNSTPTVMFRVTADGKVGIGSATPAYELDVTGSSRLSGFQYFSANGGGPVFTNTQGVISAYGQLFIRGGTFIKLGDNNAINILLAEGGGSVGVGDATPNHKLDVEGNIGLIADGYINWGDTDGTTGYGFRDNAGSVEFKDSGGNWTDLSGIVSSPWTDAGTYLYPTAGEVLGNSISAGSNKLAGIYLADSAPLYFGTDNDIGYTFSGTTLAVTQGNNDINFDSNTLFIDGSANSVGIGTAAPTKKLHVFGSNYADSSIGIQTQIGLNNSQINFEIVPWSSNEAHTIFKAWGANVMSLTSAGRVGIGTVPSAYYATSKLFVPKGTGDTALIAGAKSNDLTTTENFDFLLMGSASLAHTFFRVSDIGNVYLRAGNFIAPVSDSTTALNIANAAGTPFVRFDTTNSRVGIGTTPLTELDILGVHGVRVMNSSNNSYLSLNSLGEDGWPNIHAYSTVETAGYQLGFLEDLPGLIGIQTITPDPIIIAPASSEVARFTTDGKLGINDSSPDVSLSIVGIDGIQFENSISGASIYMTATIDDWPYIYGNTLTGTDWTIGLIEDIGSYFGIGTATPDPMYLFTGFTIGAVLDENSRFGIGDLTPDHLLDVEGNIGLISGGYVNWGDTDGTTGYGFRDNSGTIEYKNSAGSWAAISGIVSSPWTDGGTYLYPTSGEVLGNSTSAGANKLAGIYLADSSPLYFGTDNDISFAFSVGVLNITQGIYGVNFDAGTLFVNGNDNRVGINTTSPVAPFDARYVSTLSAGSTERTAWISYSDTGIVTTGTDTSMALQVNATRTGATGGTINTYGGYFFASGDTGGDSTAIALYASAFSADNNYAAIFNLGDVGIGTQTPTYKLDIASANSGVRVTDTISGASIRINPAQDDWPYIAGNSSSGLIADWQLGIIDTLGGLAGIGTASPDPFILMSDSTEVLRVTENGRVGINESNPMYDLDITAGIGFRVADSTSGAEITLEPSGDDWPSIRANSISNPDWGIGVFEEVGPGGGDFGLGTISNDNIYFFTGGADQWSVLTSNGRFGIGDLTPDHLLDVEGNIGLSASSYINWGDTDGTTGYGFRDNAGTVEYKNSGGSWAAISGIVSSPWSDAGTYLYPTSGEVLGNSTSAGANKIAGLYLADSAPLNFGTDNDVSYTFSGSELAVAMGNNDLNFDSNTLFIDGSANQVAIGNNTARGNFDVYGTNAEVHVGTANAGYLAVGAQSDYSSNWTGSNVILLNTVALQGTGSSQLYVRNHSNSAYGRVTAANYYASSSGSTSAVTFGMTNENTGLYFPSSNIGFSVGGTEYARLTTTGRLGIRDTTPDAILDFDFSSTSTSAGTEYGAYFLTSDTGVVTTGTDITYGLYNTVTRTGATSGTITSYGGYFSALGDTGGTSTAIGLYATASGADTNYAAIFDQGSVGVGTATPEQKFHVSGGNILLDYNQALQGEYSVGGTYYDLIKLGSGNDVALGNSSRSTNIIGEPYITIVTGVTQRWQFYSNQFRPITDNTNQVGINTQRVYQGWFGTGGVSIGTASTPPSSGLYVSGNVGIGSATSPSYNLDVRGTSGRIGAIATGAGTGGVFIGYSNAASLYSIQTDPINTSGNLRFAFNSNTAIDIAQSGRVGIGGVTSPNAFLDITAATTSLAQLNLTSSAGTNPSSPTSGDLWWNGTNLYFYNGSSNVDLLGGGGSSPWTDAGAYLHPTSGEVLGNSASAGSNKLAGIYLADSSPLYFGTDNDVNYSFSGTTLAVTTGNNDLNFDSDTLFIDGSADFVGIGTASPSSKLDVLRAFTADSGDVATLSASATYSTTAQTGYTSVFNSTGTLGVGIQGFHNFRATGNSITTSSTIAHISAFKSGSGILGAASTCNSTTCTVTTMAGLFLGPNATVGSGNTLNVTSEYGIYIRGQNTLDSGGTYNATNWYGVYVGGPGAAATTTNSYGVYIAEQNNATNPYALYSNSGAPSYFNGNLGLGDTSPDFKLSVVGNIGIEASGYLNWGTTSGSTGYGIRDNAGTIEFKNSGGSWAALGGGGSSPWTDAGTYLYPTSAEVLGNSASAGSNKLAGIYLADSSPLTFGTDNDISLSFSGTSLAVTQGTADINFDSNTLFIDGSENGVAIGQASAEYQLTLAGEASDNTDFEGISIGQYARLFSGNGGYTSLMNPVSEVSFIIGSYAQVVNGHLVTWGVDNFGDLELGFSNATNVYIGSTGTPTIINDTLEVTTLGAAGATSLCRNASNEIATCSSSIKYKQNVADLALGLDTVQQLRPVTFNWKDTGSADLGFVAEEVYAVAPLLTFNNKAGQLEGVKYEQLTAVLVNAVQEQQGNISSTQTYLNQFRDSYEGKLAQIIADYNAGKLTNPTAPSPTGNQVSQYWNLDGESLSTLYALSVSTLTSESLNANTLTASNATLSNLVASMLDVGTGTLKISGNGLVSVAGDLVISGQIRSSTGQLKLGSPVTATDLTVEKISINRTDPTKASAGKGSIVAGQLSARISTSALTSDSLIFVTPEVPVTIGSKWVEEGVFEVTISSPLVEDLNFNWWIVN